MNVGRADGAIAEDGRRHDVRVDGCRGGDGSDRFTGELCYAFRRRFDDETTDAFACVCFSDTGWRAVDDSNAALQFFVMR